MFRALLLQLARLGDLIQSLPVITSLHTEFPEQQLDLLCAAPMVPLGQLLPGIHNVFPWEGEQWHAFSRILNGNRKQSLEVLEKYLADLAFPDYSVAYNLNNHPRSILAAHLFSEQVIGSGHLGPLNSGRPPWVEYLQQVAHERGKNRIHLADAFCGLCNVRPPMVVPTIQAREVELPVDLAKIVNDGSLAKIGIVLGAGDADRRVPVATWKDLIEACAKHLPNCVCVLIGGPGEREIAMAIENQLSAIYLSRILNCVGRTSLPELAHIFNRCQWVVGSDTGPLHLAVACGTRAIGWYFSRARVHETGPYGVGHYVWQYQGISHVDSTSRSGMKGQTHLPGSWPVLETLQLIRDQNSDKRLTEWELWNSHHDEWGMFYTNEENSETVVEQREQVWTELSAKASSHQVFFNGHAGIAG